MIGHVDGSVDSVEYHEVLFDPVAKGKEFDVNMSGPCSGLLCITHCGAAVVILVEECCSFLRDVEVP